jgi:hydrogenase expression/formation protein HypC
MCLAVPGRILEIEGTLARVDFGHGTVRDVDVSLVDVGVGKYILVHTGYAIQVLDENEAKASLDLWRDILDRLEGE